MEFTIKRAELAQALSQVAKTATSFEKAIVPITANVLITARPDNVVVLAATDFFSDFRQELPAEVKTPGVTSVSAEHLSKWVATVRGAEIKFRLTDKRLNLSTKGANSWLAFITPDDFPMKPFGESDDAKTIARVQTSEFAAAIKKALVCAANSDSREQLYSVYIDIFPDDEIVVVGTDGLRVAIRKMSCPTFGRVGLLVGRPNAIELERALSMCGGEATLITDGRRLQVICGDINFATQLVAHQYVDYNMLLSGLEMNAGVWVDREDIIAAVKAVKIFATGFSIPFIHLETTADGKMIVKTVDDDPSEIGRGEAVVDVSATGVLNRDYNATMLLESLNIINSPNVWIYEKVKSIAQANGADFILPMLFISETDKDENDVHIISPRATLGE